VCLIVDANAATRFLARSSAIVDWLTGNRGLPRIVAAGRLRQELVIITEVKRLLVQLERAGRLRSVDSDRLRAEEERLFQDAECRSNDRHVLALAIVSGARTLVTGAAALIADFRNHRIINSPRGKIYQDPARHARLLCHTPSCGVQRAPADRRNRAYTRRSN